MRLKRARNPESAHPWLEGKKIGLGQPFFLQISSFSQLCMAIPVPFSKVREKIKQLFKHVHREIDIADLERPRSRVLYAGMAEDLLYYLKDGPVISSFKEIKFPRIHVKSQQIKSMTFDFYPQVDLEGFVDDDFVDDFLH